MSSSLLHFPGAARHFFSSCPGGLEHTILPYCSMEHCQQRLKWVVLGKHSGKEKEGDLGGLLFSLHFSIASAVLFFFLSSPKREIEQKQKINWFSHCKCYSKGDC